MGRGGVDWGLVVLVVVWACAVVERVEASHKQGQEKLEVVSMGLEKETEGGSGFLQDLLGEGQGCTQGKAQQRDGRMGVVESGHPKGDADSWVPEGDWTPKDG